MTMELVKNEFFLDSTSGITVMRFPINHTLFQFLIIYTRGRGVHFSIEIEYDYSDLDNLKEFTFVVIRDGEDPPVPDGTDDVRFAATTYNKDVDTLYHLYVVTKKAIIQ